MKRLLFLNGCIRRKGVSRTWELCSHYLEQYKIRYPETEIQELRLSECGLGCYYEEEIQKRNALLAAGRHDDEMFALARQFAQADEILVGVPYWDMSFPSVLKVYVEHVCAEGITFQTTEKGLNGLSKFQDMVYLSTAGGYVQGKNCGAEYMKAIAEFLGHGSYRYFVAEGLDIAGNDAARIMKEAERGLERLFR